jgi:purine-binding chemotaxis protein CheW
MTRRAIIGPNNLAKAPYVTSPIYCLREFPDEVEKLKYLTFMLADQFCGIELSRARELLGYMTFSPLTGGHPSVVGVFDLRGKMTRVIDLRLRFGLPATRTDDTVMIIIDADGASHALIVDNVLGIESPATIEPAAILTRSSIDPRFIAGIAQVKDQTLLLIDLKNALVIPPPLPKAA